jgi:indole-3-glycerol phosphate synthase
MTVLADIIAGTRRKVTQARSTADLRDLEKQAAEHTPRGFRKALESAGKEGIRVIAELKKASPSRGLIRSDFDPVALAQEMESAGAAALSVLTDEEFFRGSLGNLRAASVSTAIPCLRKDFILDEFQLLEARANCADAVLLIVAALTQTELSSLAKKATELSMDVLCEVHDEEELGRALEAGSDLIGVNSRDLHTFKVDLDVAFRLAESLPHGAMAVAESGIDNGAHIARLRLAGYDAFLIGEGLMRATSPGETLKSLISQALSFSPAADDQRPTTVL